MWAWAFKSIAKINCKSWEVVGPDVQRGWKAVVALEGALCAPGTTTSAVWMGRALVRLACDHGLLTLEEVPGDVQEECGVQPAQETPMPPSDDNDQAATERNGKNGAAGEGEGEAATNEGANTAKETPPSGGEGEGKGKGEGAGTGEGDGGGKGDDGDKDTGPVKGGAASHSINAKGAIRQSTRVKQQKTLFNCAQLGGQGTPMPATGVNSSDAEETVSKQSAPSHGSMGIHPVYTAPTPAPTDVGQGMTLRPCS